jgi:beta-lactam-binding protein with PASTA domain
VSDDNTSQGRSAADRSGGEPPAGGGAAGSGAPAGGKVWLWVAVGVLVLLAIGAGVWYFAQGPKVAVPNTVGRSQAEAKGLIEGAGLTLGVVTEAKESTAAPGEVVGQSPAPGAKVDKGSKVDLTVAAGPALVSVPDVVGKTKAEAQKTLTDAGLLSRVVVEANAAPKDQAFGQLPEAGSKVTSGSVVAVGVSSGPAPQMAKVPNVTGKPQATAESEIRTAGFVPVAFKDYSDSVAAGNVIGQLPEAGYSAVVGHEVALVVSLGKTPAQTVAVPAVKGKPQADAESAVKAAGLVPVSTKGYSDTAAAGIVIGQSPGAGTGLPKGGQVAILVSQGKAPVGGATVPDVKGKSESDAVSILEGAGLTGTVMKDYSDTVPAGIVSGQLPDPGSEVLKGSDVTILVSLGKGGQSSAKVPSVVGKSKSEAEKAVKDAGLVPLPLNEPSPDVAVGTVARQLPAAGKAVAAGSQVAILVSSGKPENAVAVPDVKGKTREDAEAALREAGFEPLILEDVDPTVPAGLVFGQLPAAGTKLPAGSTVAIGVSKGAP